MTDNDAAGGVGMQDIDVFTAVPRFRDFGAALDGFTLSVCCCERVSCLRAMHGTVWAILEITSDQSWQLPMIRRVRSHAIGRNAHITVLIDKADQSLIDLTLAMGANDVLTLDATTEDLATHFTVLTREGHLRGGLSRVPIGHLMLDCASFSVEHAGRKVPLQPSELFVLRYFAANPSRLINPFELESLMATRPGLGERSLRKSVERLRLKLRQAGLPDPLRAVRSEGYVYDRA